MKTSKDRACCVIIHKGGLLFVEQMVNGQLRHVFIGGGVEEGETPCAAALRELEEEANIRGEIVFGPAMVQTSMKEYVFIVNIPEDAAPSLGYDPELPLDRQDIKGLVWLDAREDIEKFNAFDRAYFSAILEEGRRREARGEWISILEGITNPSMSS